MNKEALNTEVGQEGELFDPIDIGNQDPFPQPDIPPDPQDPPRDPDIPTATIQMGERKKTDLLAAIRQLEFKLYMLAGFGIRLAMLSFDADKRKPERILAADLEYLENVWRSYNNQRSSKGAGI